MIRPKVTDIDCALPGGTCNDTRKERSRSNGVKVKKWLSVTRGPGVEGAITHKVPWLLGPWVEDWWWGGKVSGWRRERDRSLGVGPTRSLGGGGKARSLGGGPTRSLGGGGKARSLGGGGKARSLGGGGKARSLDARREGKVSGWRREG